MQKQDRYCLSNLRSQLLDHSVYAEVASVEDLRRFMQDHVFAVWDFMSLLKRLQQDLTCTNVPWFPARNAKAARLINDIVIGEETDVDPDGSYVSHLDLYLRAMEDVGASTHQFDTFHSLARAGTSIEAAMVQTEVPPHVQAFVAHTMMLAQSGSTEEVLAAFFYGREDIIPEMFSRLRKILPGARKTNDPLRHLSTISSGTLSSMVTVTGQWGGSCSMDWLRTRRRRTSGRCTQRATASRLGSTFGMAH